jgi:hypothetical protein
MLNATYFAITDKTFSHLAFTLDTGAPTLRLMIFDTGGVPLDGVVAWGAAFIFFVDELLILAAVIAVEVDDDAATADAGRFRPAPLFAPVSKPAVHPIITACCARI